MNLEEGIVTHLEADANVDAVGGDRFYPLRIPQDATRPATAYQRISGPRDHSQSGASGLVRARVQFTCEGNTYAEAKSLADVIRVSLDGFSGTMGTVTVDAALVEDEIDRWGETYELPVVRLDVMFWYQE